MNQYYLEIYLENLYPQNTNIEESQWQYWFNQWFNYLGLDLEPDKTYEISLRLTDDRDIQSLNRQFRHQDKPTDVLSFAGLEDDFPEIVEIESIVLGDIIISIETATKQAKLENHTLEIELAWLASHGLLHLLGYNHPDDNSLEYMLNTQAQLLNEIGINPPSVKKYFS